MKVEKNSKGITLVALVVTIIVLIILATISIRAVFSERGIINQAKEAKEMHEDAKEEEGQTIGDLMGEYNSVKQDIMLQGESYNGIYSASGLEGKIAPADLFDYEVISDVGGENETGADGLPVRTARILRIKPQYANNDGYNPETNTNNLTDTNYEVIYKGERIKDILVVPYEVENNGTMYKITEVDLSVASDPGSRGLPHIETIIYPNTVEKIQTRGSRSTEGRETENNVTKTVILSKKLEEIVDYAFGACSELTNITIPNNVTSIGKLAFYGCSGITNIAIPSSVTSIGDNAFTECSALTGITIPNSVTSISPWAFEKCTSLATITIPSSVTSIGEYAFANCSSLTQINIKKSENSITGKPWGASNATITWNYTGN